VAIAAGYGHNVATAYLAGDFDGSRRVDLIDLAAFAARWMDTDCAKSNCWCKQTDLDKLGTVDMADLAILTQHWLENYEYQDLQT